MVASPHVCLTIQLGFQLHQALIPCYQVAWQVRGKR
jgi:hypothetical protein